ncbi:MAG: LptA/OstA family protein [Pseudomonadota bacterium]
MKALTPLIAAAWLCAAPAAAQLSSEGGRILIDADVGEVFERERRIVYSGNVDVKQGDARLQADELVVRYKATGEVERDSAFSGFGDLDTIVATGNVFYVTSELRARGETATYNADADSIVLSGDVVLLRGQDVAKGEELIVEISRGVSTLSPGESGRVQMSIDPGDSVGGGANVEDALDGAADDLASASDSGSE